MISATGRKPKQKIDWSAVSREILSLTDLGAVAEEWGVPFSSNGANESGWRECHAIDREDANPSAAVCVESDNGDLGMYRDLGGGEEKAISFFELGARLGRYADWRECRADLAKRAGVELPEKKQRRTLAEAESDQITFLTSDKLAPLREMRANQLAAAKPGTTAQAILDSGAQLARWSGGGIVFAIHGYSAAGPPGARATILYRPDGRLFPAVKMSGGRTLKKRKTHLVSGSEDSIIVVGRWDALKDRPKVLLCEGLPDAWATRSIAPDEFAVVTTTHGSNSVASDLAKALAGKIVWNLSDPDDAGRKGAKLRAKALLQSEAKAAEVRDILLPGGKDARDFIRSGGDWAAFESLAAAAEPMRPGSLDPLAFIESISNGVEVEVETPDGTITKIEPLKMPDVMELVNRVTVGALNRLVNGDLFVNDSHGICWFAKPDSLFGWLAQFKQVKWYTKPGFVSKGEFFHELQRTAKAFSAIESLPHEPKLADHFYACPEYEPGEGAALNQLVDFFRPETTADRELIRALFVTPCWGGRPGSRPAWAITSDGGRGVGKTKLAESLAYLWGGFIDVSANEDIETLKSRLLSSGAMSSRIALLDNVKAGVFSSATLEALITTPTISGKRLYHGEAIRPNTINWLITINGLGLSTDLAQRCVIVKLLRGENRSTWFEDVIGFIDANRQQLLADCIGFLRSPPTAELPRYSRWAAWEGAILSRLENPADAQRLILERQAACDADSDEMGLVEDFFADQLYKLGYRPDSESVRIPVAIVARWFNWATGDRTRTAGVTRRLKQASDEGQLPRLSVDPSRTYGRCFVWDGPHCDASESTQNDLLKRIGQAAQNKDAKDAW